MKIFSSFNAFTGKLWIISGVLMAVTLNAEKNADNFPGRETVQLTDDLRYKRGYSFVRLTNGMTHYELSGPENGQVVVLVHGASLSPIWARVFAADSIFVAARATSTGPATTQTIAQKRTPTTHRSCPAICLCSR